MAATGGLRLMDVPSLRIALLTGLPSHQCTIPIYSCCMLVIILAAAALGICTKARRRTTSAIVLIEGVLIARAAKSTRWRR